MLVLHTLWDHREGGALLAWAEDADLAADAARRAVSPDQGRPTRRGAPPASS